MKLHEYLRRTNYDYELSKKLFKLKDMARLCRDAKLMYIAEDLLTALDKLLDIELEVRE